VFFSCFLTFFGGVTPLKLDFDRFWSSDLDAVDFWVTFTWCITVKSGVVLTMGPCGGTHGGMFKMRSLLHGLSL